MRGQTKKGLRTVYKMVSWIQPGRVVVCPGGQTVTHEDQLISARRRTVMQPKFVVDVQRYQLDIFGFIYV